MVSSVIIQQLLDPGKTEVELLVVGEQMVG